MDVDSCFARAPDPSARDAAESTPPAPLFQCDSRAPSRGRPGRRTPTPVGRRAEGNGSRPTSGRTPSVLGGRACVPIPEQGRSAPLSNRPAARTSMSRWDYAEFTIETPAEHGKPAPEVSPRRIVGGPIHFVGASMDRPNPGEHPTEPRRTEPRSSSDRVCYSDTNRSRCASTLPSTDATMRSRRLEIAGRSRTGFRSRAAARTELECDAHRIPASWAASWRSSCS
jgi:hypothetical protein